MIIEKIETRLMSDTDNKAISNKEEICFKKHSKLTTHFNVTLKKFAWKHSLEIASIFLWCYQIAI